MMMDPRHEDIYEHIGWVETRLNDRVTELEGRIAALEKLGGATPAEVALATPGTRKFGFDVDTRKENDNGT